MTRAARGVLHGCAAAAQALTWLPVGHLGLLAVAGSVPPRRVVLRPEPETRFVVVVPGRNEEEFVAAAVGSLLRARYPRELMRVVVVADNCHDGTAEVARAAGAEAWERNDPARASKGAALGWAFERLLAEDPDWDALLVLDADGTVDRDLFRVLDARIDDVAVLQAERRVGNPRPNLMTRLSEVSTDAQTVLRPRARQHLGGAAKLVGTGMVFRRDVLRLIPWHAEGLVEDVEYWLTLLQEGIRPEFEPRAQVADLMPETMSAARRQRERWQAGRAGLARGRARSSLRLSLRRRDPVLLEAVVSELLLPTLSVTGTAVVGSTALSLLLRRRGMSTGALQALVVTVHVLAGLRAAGASAATYRALAASPLVAIWKTWLALRLRLHPPASGWQSTRGTTGAGR